MCRQLYIVLFYLLLISDANSQSVYWERTYGSRLYEEGKKIISTADSGFLVVGSTSGYGANSDVYLLKVNKYGNFLWHKWYGGFNVDLAVSVKELPDKGFIVCGNSNSFGSTGYDFYILRVDSTGNIIWENNYGGYDWDFADEIALSPDGGFVIAGTTFSYGSGGSDIYLIKINASGTLLWDTTYGGSGNEEGRGIAIDPAGNIYIAGAISSIGYGNYDAYLLKIAPNKDTVWTKYFGSAAEDKFNDVIFTSDSFIVAAGYTKGNNSTTDTYLLKTDTNGTIVWVENSLVPATSEWVETIAENKLKGFLTVGTYNTGTTGVNEIHFMQWTKNGIFVRGGSRGGTYDDFGYSGIALADSGYAFVGTTESFGNGNTDIFIARFDSLLNPINSVTISVQEQVELNNLCVFPVPASEMVFVFAQQKNISIHKAILYSMNGEKIKEWSDDNIGEQGLSLNGVSSGMYWLELHSENMQYVVKLPVISNQ